MGVIVGFRKGFLLFQVPWFVGSHKIKKVLKPQVRGYFYYHIFLVFIGLNPSGTVELYYTNKQQN